MGAAILRSRNRSFAPFPAVRRQNIPDFSLQPKGEGSAPVAERFLGFCRRKRRHEQAPIQAVGAQDSAEMPRVLWEGAAF